MKQEQFDKLMDCLLYTWNAEEENNKAYNYAMKIIDEEEER